HGSTRSPRSCALANPTAHSRPATEPSTGPPNDTSKPSPNGSTDPPPHSTPTATATLHPPQPSTITPTTSVDPSPSSLPHPSAASAARHQPPAGPSTPHRLGRRATTPSASATANVRASARLLAVKSGCIV